MESSYPNSTASSPRSREIECDAATDDPLPPPRVKLMCSYGGRILPRVNNDHNSNNNQNHLCYVGGETKILAIDRFTRYSSVMAKLRALSCSDDVFLKYQLPGEDLDALISVTNDEDLENMMIEYDRLPRTGSRPVPRFRLFLFGLVPANIVKDPLPAIENPDYLFGLDAEVMDPTAERMEMMISEAKDPAVERPVPMRSEENDLALEKVAQMTSEVKDSVVEIVAPMRSEVKDSVEITAATIRTEVKDPVVEVTAVPMRLEVENPVLMRSQVQDVAMEKMEPMRPEVKDLAVEKVEPMRSEVKNLVEEKVEPLSSKVMDLAVEKAAPMGSETKEPAVEKAVPSRLGAPVHVQETARPMIAKQQQQPTLPRVEYFVPPVQDDYRFVDRLPRLPSVDESFYFVPVNLGPGPVFYTAVQRFVPLVAYDSVPPVYVAQPAKAAAYDSGMRAQAVETGGGYAGPTVGPYDNRGGFPAAYDSTGRAVYYTGLGLVNNLEIAAESKVLKPSQVS